MEFRPLASSSSGNAYLLTAPGDASLLIECGLPWREIQEALSFEASKLSAVLVSHEHGDHCKSLMDATGAGVDCYMSAGTFGALGRPASGNRIRNASPGTTLTVGPWKVRAFPVAHDAKEPLGFFVQAPDGDRLVYISDASGCGRKFGGLTHLAIECNHDVELLAASNLDRLVKARVAANHMNLEACTRFLKLQDLSKVRGIWLIHLSDAHSDAVRFRNEIASATGRPVMVAAAREPRPVEKPQPRASLPPDTVAGKLLSVDTGTSKKGNSYMKLKLEGMQGTLFVWNTRLQDPISTAVGKRVELATVVERDYRVVKGIVRLGDAEWDGDVPVIQRNSEVQQNADPVRGVRLVDDDVPF